MLLDVADVTFQGMTRQEAEDRKIAYIDPVGVREAYGKITVLNLSSDKKVLIGLPMTIAGIQGNHRFDKAQHSTYR